MRGCCATVYGMDERLYRTEESPENTERPMERHRKIGAWTTLLGFGGHAAIFIGANAHILNQDSQLTYQAWIISGVVGFTGAGWYGGAKMLSPSEADRDT